MPRVKQTEEVLVAKIAELETKRKALKKKLQVMRIRAAATRRKKILTSIRRNEKEVLDLIKTKAPEFFDRLSQAPVRKKRAAKKATGRRSRAKAAA